MENKNYIVNRNEVYVGEVVKANSISRYGGQDELLLKRGDLIANPYVRLRSCLFVPTEDNYSNDLLYKCPNYPILNYTKDSACLNLRDRVVIRKCLNLEDVLIHLKYNEELTINDIIRLRNTLFTGRYAKDNPGLFGKREIVPDDFVAYKNGEVSTDYYVRLKAYRKFVGLSTKRKFEVVKEAIFPEYMMDEIDDYGNKENYDKEIIDSFVSVPGEGKVKKLIKN